MEGINKTEESKIEKKNKNILIIVLIILVIILLLGLVFLIIDIMNDKKDDGKLDTTKTTETTTVPVIGEKLRKAYVEESIELKNAKDGDSIFTEFGDVDITLKNKKLKMHYEDRIGNTSDYESEEEYEEAKANSFKYDKELDNIKSVKYYTTERGEYSVIFFISYSNECWYLELGSHVEDELKFTKSKVKVTDVKAQAYRYAMFFLIDDEGNYYDMKTNILIDKNIYLIADSYEDNEVLVMTNSDVYLNGKKQDIKYKSAIYDSTGLEYILAEDGYVYDITEKGMKKANNSKYVKSDNDNNLIITFENGEKLEVFMGYILDREE